MGILINRKDGEALAVSCCGFNVPPQEEIPQDQSDHPEILVAMIPLCGYYATVNGSYRLYKNAKGEFHLAYQYQIFSCSDRKNRIMLKDDNRDIRITSDVDALPGKELMWCLYEDLKDYLESEGYSILANC